jgi:lysine N6-hydroxylase
MKHSTIYDVAGIGIGPFNLGMAALAEPIANLNCIFFDSKPCFTWHPGLMLDFAKLQVPFFADLVTGAEPWSKFGFLTFLKHMGRLYQFANLEDNYISRKEYNIYCQWVAQQLKSLRFGYIVNSIIYNQDKSVYEITANSKGVEHFFAARHIVLGIGSVPAWPKDIPPISGEGILHSGEYLYKKEQILKARAVTIIGSGQSAAEIFYDLLQENSRATESLHWVTRTERFYSMETSKLCHEMTSPDYIDYFHSLPAKKRQESLGRQDNLYKGINQELLAEIYRLLYHQSPHQKVHLQTNTALYSIEEINGWYMLDFYQREQQRHYFHNTEVLVMATGYQRIVPDFIDPIRDRIQWEENGLYKVDRDYSIGYMQADIFVQNAELHSHGFNAPDLGMGAYRNSIILNKILGYEHFMVEKETAFQHFGM